MLALTGFKRLGLLKFIRLVIPPYNICFVRFSLSKAQADVNLFFWDRRCLSRGRGRSWPFSRVGTPPKTTSARHLTDFVRSSNWSKLQFPWRLLNSLPSSQRIAWIHYFPLEANIEQFPTLLVAFRKTKIRWHREIEKTKPPWKQYSFLVVKSPTL